MNTNKFDNNRKGVLSMTTTAQKWGGSIGVRIPKRLADKYGVDNGSQIKITETKDEKGIVIMPITDKPTLNDLLEMCNPQDRHEEIDFGIKGNELI